jgi:hypothetical protein
MFRENDEQLNVMAELARLFESIIKEGEENGRLRFGDNAREDLLLIERSRAITKFYNHLDGFKQHIEEYYSKELWRKGERFPTNWMMEDPSIHSVIQKTRLVDVLNYIDKHTLDAKDEETAELSKGLKYSPIAKTGRNKSKKVDYHYSLILVNDDFYKDAMRSLALAKITIQKYIQRFCELGILIKLTKTGKGGKELLYADGYYTRWTDSKFVKHPFLKNTPDIKKGLKNFRLA